MRRKFSRKGKHFLLRTMLPAALILAACAGGAYAVNASRYNTIFLPGTVINQLDVSEMSLAEAEKMIRAREEDHSITLKFRGGSEQTLGADDVKLRYPCGKELESILKDQNRYSWLSRQFSDELDYTLSTSLTYDRNALEKAISALPEMQSGNYEKPKDAHLDVTSDNQYYLVHETEGTELIPSVLKKETGKAIVSGAEELDFTEVEGAYAEPEIRSDDKALIDRMDSLNTLMGAKVSVKLSNGTTREIDRSITKDWVTTEPDGRWTVRPEEIEKDAAAVIAEVAKADDNYGYYRAFASTNFGMQRFDSDNLHGHTLDQAAMAKTLADMVMKGETGVIEPVYSQFEDNKDPQMGGTYVEVDIYYQHVYYYENYELVYDCKCVTGTEGYRSTPSGIFSIQDKERGRTLNGYSSDGSLAYSAYVSYWMCFYPHYGLHDASWRDSFGGSIYEYDGSHGCVNLPTYAARDLYNMLDYGTPVVVLRGKNYEDA